MDVEIPVLSGHLIVPTQSGFSLNRISKKVGYVRDFFVNQPHTFNKLITSIDQRHIIWTIIVSISWGMIDKNEFWYVEMFFVLISL